MYSVYVVCTAVKDCCTVLYQQIKDSLIKMNIAEFSGNCTLQYTIHLVLMYFCLPTCYNLETYSSEIFLKQSQFNLYFFQFNLMHGGLNMNLTKPKFKSQRIMNILFSVLAQKPQVWKETLIIKCNYNLKIKISEMCKKIINLERKRARFFQTTVWIEIVKMYLSCIYNVGNSFLSFIQIWWCVFFHNPLILYSSRYRVCNMILVYDLCVPNVAYGSSS